MLRALLTFYCVRREAEIVDALVDLLIQITQKIARKAKKRVEKELVADGALLIRGKTGILYRIAEAASEHPDGIVREVIFPVASKETIDTLVKEHRASKGYDEEVHTAMRGSYGSYYRRMLPKLLDVLDLQSNNETHRPLLEAIEMLKARRDEPTQFYKLSDVAVKGVIRKKWRDVVIERGPDGKQRVNRINYELCVLQSLREQVRCKEVWIAGADRFRNPDHDLPSDLALTQHSHHQGQSSAVIPASARGCWFFVETRRMAHIQLEALVGRDGDAKIPTTTVMCTRPQCHFALRYRDVGSGPTSVGASQRSTGTCVFERGPVQYVFQCARRMWARGEACVPHCGSCRSARTLSSAAPIRGSGPRHVKRIGSGIDNQ